MNTTLQRWGNSQGIRIPKKYVESLGMEIGAELTVELASDQSVITIKPVKDTRPIRGRHKIEDLLAESSPDAFQGEEEWGTQQGKEVW